MFQQNYTDKGSEHSKESRNGTADYIDKQERLHCAFFRMKEATAEARSDMGDTSSEMSPSPL